MQRRRCWSDPREKRMGAGRDRPIITDNDLSRWLARSRSWNTSMSIRRDLKASRLPLFGRPRTATFKACPTILQALEGEKGAVPLPARPDGSFL